ncbi:MAG: hypothetical protein COC22_03305 [Flavobacteriaceae bacterium]|nr:MAG: hypothetical protein COC22_03305 [Flavobacteriaceae bacterium]
MGHKRPFIFYTNGYDIFFWDDERYPPRKAYGFFRREDLNRRRFQKENVRPLSDSLIDTNIAARPYQVKAIRRILETFEMAERKALLVMATGTGKTRVAVVLVDLLMRAKRIKNVLFLVDRKKLRKQVRDSFMELLPDSPRKILSTGDEDLDKRVYFATYPAMNNLYPKYSPAAFDLIIADESHRSIYKKYRGIFQYFDALQVGLTSTPVDFVERNTFGIFNCEQGVPTDHYALEQAIDEEWLVNYRVFDVRTQFQIDGIQPGDLTDDAKEELERQGIDPEDFLIQGTLGLGASCYFKEA